MQSAPDPQLKELKKLGEPHTDKKKSFWSFRRIISLVTLVLVAIVLWNARQEIFDAVHYLKKANIWWILVLIPEQLLMYYCAGEIFFSYMKAKRGGKKLSAWSLARISFELNFVNNAIPSGGFSGLGYIIWRLQPFGISPGQTSFMYGLRYAITICANQLQTILAILALVLTSGIVAGSGWITKLIFLSSSGILALIATLFYIAQNKKRILWCANKLTALANFVVRKVTFGKKRNVVKSKTLEQFFVDLRSDLVIAKRNKRCLVKPVLWGIVYSFLEVAVFWIVGISMGHPDILPQIMIGEAAASLIGGIIPTPGGIGGYEGTMILIMSGLGVNTSLATATVVTTRILILCGTIASGYGFYQHAIAKLGKPSSQPVKKDAS